MKKLFNVLIIAGFAAGCEEAPTPPAKTPSANVDAVKDASADAAGKVKEAAGDAVDKFNAPIPTGTTTPMNPAQTVDKVDEDAPKEFTTTESGLKYRILRKTDGKKPTAKNTVKCHYKGWLDNGKEFDSSYTRGEPIEFPLNGVIPGWTEGMQLVGEGGMIELEIPANLGYGARGAGASVPPNATLHFIVELQKVK